MITERPYRRGGEFHQADHSQGRSAADRVANRPVTPDWSAAYTKNSGKMDATMRIQLAEDRSGTAQQYVRELRTAFDRDRRFADLEFALQCRRADPRRLERRQSPRRSTSGSPERIMQAAHEIADLIRRKAAAVDGVVDARVMQAQDYPELRHRRRSGQGGRSRVCRRKT